MEFEGFVMKKSGMTALTKGGQKTVHQGKGSQQQPLSVHNNVSASGSAQPSAGLNNYAKATPMAQPTPPATTGLGSGNWPGIGQ
jgi:hypothetical protein